LIEGGKNLPKAIHKKIVEIAFLIFVCKKQKVINERKRNIERSDTTGAAYYKKIFREKQGAPHQYELCIDSSVGVQSGKLTVRVFEIGIPVFHAGS